MKFERASVDGAGVTYNANVDGSVTPVEFHIGGDFAVEAISLMVFIRDASVADGAYGAVTALANGVTIEVQDGDDAVVNDLLDGGALTANRDFYKYAPKVERGDDWLSAFIPLDAGLDLPFTSKIVITINDDLTGLDEHYFYAVGL